MVNGRKIDAKKIMLPLTKAEDECIKNCSERVKELMGTDSSGHDYLHMERVMKLSEKIADVTVGKTSVNRFDLMMIGLLHDVDDRKISPDTAGTLQNARDIMAEHSNIISEERADKILSAINNLSYSKGKIPDSIEGKIVQDADRLDAIGAIGIARAFAFGGSHGLPIYEPGSELSNERGNMTNTFNHFREKLLNLENTMNTEEGKKIAHERTEFMKIYLDEFCKDTGCSYRMSELDFKKTKANSAFDQLQTEKSKMDRNGSTNVVIDPKMFE